MAIRKNFKSQKILCWVGKVLFPSPKTATKCVALQNFLSPRIIHHHSSWATLLSCQLAFLAEASKKPDLMEVCPISSLHCPLLRMTSFLDCWKNLTHAPWLQYRAKEASLPFRGAEMPLKSFVMRNDFYRWNKKCESTIRAFYVLQPHWKILLILPSSILVCLHNHYFGGVGFKDFCHLI